jgi:phage/plasmid primase-like uncharacterized protein
MFTSDYHNRDLLERARTFDILAIAQRYGATLKRAGSHEFEGPCPVCGGRDRFSVNLKKQVFNCRGCGKGGDAIELVRHLSGATFPEAIATLAGEEWAPTNPPVHRHRRDEADDDNTRNAAFAARIWDAARPIKGTLAEHYLVRVRGIDIDQILDIDDALRFAASCPFDRKELPCLVALVRNVVTDDPMGIVRTALDSSGCKIDRLALGPTKGGAIKLWSDAAITTGLVVGEGLETVAAAATRVVHRGTLLQPAWALIYRGNLRDFPVLEGLEALTVLVDNDESGAGQDDAEACARHWAVAGRRVELLIPNIVGADFNDIAVGGVR